jgi:hypothetical protein
MTSDPLGIYFPNVNIIIQGKRAKRHLRSGNDGTYSVDLLPGIYSVRFEYPACVSVRKRVQITRNVATKLNVVIHPKRGVCVDCRGRRSARRIPS